MKIADYGNIIVIQGNFGTKEFHLPGQRVEGLNYLFELLQNVSLELSTNNYVDDDVTVKISRHGVTRLNKHATAIISDNWVDKLFAALND